MPFKFALPCFALAVLACGCHGVTSSPGPIVDRPLEAGSFDGRLLSRAIFREVNRVRLSYGLPAVASQRKLDDAADEQASHLVLVASVEHNNFVPGEETPRARVGRVGIFPAMVGENALMMPLSGPAGATAAYTYQSFAAMMVDGWMKSPGHRANILEKDFQLTGVASRLGRSPRADAFIVYAVQVFIEPEVPRRAAGIRRRAYGADGTASRYFGQWPTHSLTTTLPTT